MISKEMEHKGVGRLFSMIAVVLALVVLGGSRVEVTKASAVEGGSSETTDPSSKVTCLSVLGESEKPPRFEQFAQREILVNTLTRKLILEARKRDKETQSFSIDVKGEDIQDKVGYHILRTRSNTGKHSCYEIPYEILDVDECSNPSLNGCHPTTRCRNTNGSYECDCPNGMVALYGECVGLTTTGAEGCNCQTLQCKKSLKCALPDACGGRCVPEATCDKGKCICPADLFGSGIICPSDGKKLIPVFDRKGVLHGPSKQEEDYCGCQARTVDYCIGVMCRPHSSCRSVGKDYTCQCDEGFVDEDGDCVDPREVRLVLLGEKRMELEQGDSFDDPFVKIKDDNLMGEKTRSIDFIYDPALNNDTLDEVGEYQAVYRVTTNWTRDKTVSVTRTVVVKDIDECTLLPSHPKYKKWHHLCDPSSRCINVEGGYECRCPNGAVGDGAVGRAAPGQRKPKNYKDGSGCRDMRPPVIEVSTEPRVIQVCKCEGLLGGGGDGDASPNCPRRDYKKELQALINRNPRAYLCGGGGGEGKKGGGPSSSSQCIKAYKRTWNEVQDLSDEVLVGPVELVKSDGVSYTFHIPLDVSDSQGIRAETKFAKVRIEEVALSTLLGKQATAAAEERNKVAASQELQNCRKALEEARQKAASLETRVQRLLEQEKVAPVTKPATPSREASLIKTIESLEHKLSACEQRRPNVSDRDGSCAPIIDTTTGSAADNSAFSIFLIGVIALTAIGIIACRVAEASKVENQVPAATAMRWQESPLPARTRAPDRTPGSPVRPFRGHVNLTPGTT